MRQGWRWRSGALGGRSIGVVPATKKRRGDLILADSLLVVLRFQCPRNEAAEVLFKAPSASTGGFSRCPPSPRPGLRGAPSVGRRAARWAAGSRSRGMAPGSGRSVDLLMRSLGPRSWSWWRGATGASSAARCSSWSRARYGAGGCTAPLRSASPWRSGVCWERRQPRCGGGCVRRRSSGPLGRRAGRPCDGGLGTSGGGGCSGRAPTLAPPCRCAAWRPGRRRCWRRARLRRPGRSRSSTAPSSAPRRRREGTSTSGG